MRGAQVDTEPDWIGNALSRPRFQPYLAAAGNDLAGALRLYWWNVDVSAAFYLPLQCLEVAVRNMMHTRLGERFGCTAWWDVVPLPDNGLRLVAEAKRKLQRRLGNSAGTSDDLVTELSFGFWVSLVSRVHDRTLWVPCLHRAFPGYRGKRALLHRQLLAMVLLRNRIMHHEPIHHRHLEADHDTVYRLLSYVSPGLAGQLGPFDRVPKLLAERPRAER